MAKSAIELEVEGLLELQKKAIQMIADMHGDDMTRAVRDSVIIMQRRAMEGPPGGYGKRKTKGGGKGYVRSQAPVGYVPVDFGRLRASLTPFVEARGPIIQGGVGTNVEYGPYQEFGTKRGVRALKYLQTTLDETRAEIQAKFDRAVSIIVKRRPK